ncbi:MAG: VapC toxin family PIN domain ribonuclease [Verrucomicrobiae bacterium]|nr:VapC toxin family PIN domain ribonuclease [Verrucomicrobiae bacterium]NNJ86172.1 VapC toxin family PIN domain ribonuclease [Akkermansiaceae bacterium]
MTILADTNIWCRYFREGQTLLSTLIEHDFLAIHPLIIGELSVGNLPDRKQTITDLNALHPVRPATFFEVHHLIEENQLWGEGLQWNDLAILASVVASENVLLWTEDNRLAEAAEKFNVCYHPAAEI